MKMDWNETFDLNGNGDFFATEVEFEEGSQYVYFSGTYRNIEGQEFAGATLEVFLCEPVYVDDDGNIVVPTAWEDYWVHMCIKFDSPEKEKFREILSTGKYSIYVSWYSPVRPGEKVHFSCYSGKVFLVSEAYDHGPFDTLEEAEEFIFNTEKADLDSWYEYGGETSFWRNAPSGEECSPPDFSMYGYRTVEGPSDYWWIEKLDGDKA